jgi:hypothetical protein
MSAAPMSGKATNFGDAFGGREADLCQKLDIKSGLLRVLKDMGVISQPQIDDITLIFKTPADQVNTLLIILQQKPSSDFPKFIEALRKTNQGHILRDHMN